MQLEAPKKPQAMLRDPTDDAGRVWWGTYFERHSAEINRRFKLARIVYWGPSVKMPLDLFSYVREAALCFTVARFLAAIVLSSTAVELILNRDTRIRNNAELRRIGGWATLNNQNLRIASDYGLPTSVLLGPGERVDDHAPIRFVQRRNKVSHGEISQLIRSLVDYDPVAEQEALDQLTRSEQFVVEWFNTAPDVQNCSIQDHQWPI